MIDDPAGDPPHLLCLSMTSGEDRMLRELAKFPDGELVSDAEGDAPSLRRNLFFSHSTDNLYGDISALRQQGYVETTLVTPTDQWLHYYRPLRVRLTSRGRVHVVTRAPVSNGITRALILLCLTGLMISGLSLLLSGDSGYLTFGLATATAGVIALLAKRAGKRLLGLY